jgi:hypothetical protein
MSDLRRPAGCQLYTLAHSELYEKRMLWLEAATIVLFMIDLIAILVRR